MQKNIYTLNHEHFYDSLDLPAFKALTEQQI